VALAKFMGLSLQKAAHANLDDAACRKSGSHQRTWAENRFFKCFHSIRQKNSPFQQSSFACIAERWKGLRPIFFGPCTLGANMGHPCTVVKKQNALWTSLEFSSYFAPALIALRSCASASSLQYLQFNCRKTEL
jgi:hypothetical protein